MTKAAPIRATTMTPMMPKMTVAIRFKSIVPVPIRRRRQNRARTPLDYTDRAASQSLFFPRMTIGYPWFRPIVRGEAEKSLIFNLLRDGNGFRHKMPG